MEYMCAETRPRFTLSPERVWREWSQTPYEFQGENPVTKCCCFLVVPFILNHSRSNSTSQSTCSLCVTLAHILLRSSIRFCVVCLLVGCFTSQQHASVSQGRICSDNFTCWHTEIEVADQAFHLTQSQHTDIGPTSPSTDPITPGAWRGSHWSANLEVTDMTRPRKNLSAVGIQTRDLPLSRRTP